MSSPYSLEKCRELVKAIEKGDLPWVRTLSSDPEIDLNWANQNEMGQTPFYLACLNGRTEIVEFFLESRGRGDREVDLNLADEHKRTPFLSACFHGYEGVVTLLLADQRVDVNQGQKYDQIPVSMAAERGKLAVVKLILASGRQIDLERRELNKGKNAHEIAMEMADRVWRAEGETIGEFLEKKARFREIAEIIREFQGDPGAVRARLRKELGFDVVWLESLLGVSLSFPSKALPKGCQQVQKITHLSLKNNSMAKLPPQLAGFTSLRELDLSGNPLTDSSAAVISTLMKSRALTSIKLTSTNIGPKGVLIIIQAMVRNFSEENYALEVLEVDDLKLLSFEGLGIIPVYILEGGSKKIVRYLLDLFRSPEGEPLFRSKLMIVGYAGIGKTSMVECLFPIFGQFYTKELVPHLFRNDEVIWHECFLKLIGNNLIQGEFRREGVVHGAVGGNNHRYFGTIRLDHFGGWSIEKIEEYTKPGFRIQLKADGQTSFTSELFCDSRVECDRWFRRIFELLKRERTHGIDIREADISGHPVVKGHFEVNRLQGKVELSVWDFAGQHDYYNSHQHFLSTRSVYLVLWNVREFVGKQANNSQDQMNQTSVPFQQRGKALDDGLEGLRFWLSSLSLHLNHSPKDKNFKVLVVGTHLDQLSDRDQNNMVQRKNIVSSLCDSHKLELSSYLEVSCINSLENIGELQDLVFREILAMKYMGERVPASYSAVEQYLKKLFQTNRLYPIVNIKEFTEHFPERLVRDALGLLSKWGKCSYFENDVRLRDKVILDPEFLSKTTLAGLFRLGPEATAMRENGLIHHRDLGVFWSDLAGQDFWENAEVLVSLMEKFDTCFVISEDQGKPFKDQRSLIPSLLPLYSRWLAATSSSSSQSPQPAPRSESIAARRQFENEKRDRFGSLWPRKLPSKQPIEMERILKFSVVPEELVSLVLTKCHPLIQEGCVWKDLVLLHLPPAPGSLHDDTQAVLQVNLEENHFLVEVRTGDYAQGIGLLERIREVFHEVNVKNQYAQWKECVRSPYSRSALVEVEEIMKAENEGKYLLCPETEIPIMVSLLKRKAGLIPPPAQVRSGYYVIKNGKTVTALEGKDHSLLKKYISFFGGNINNVIEAFRLKDELGLGEAFQFHRKQLHRQHENTPNFFKKETHLEAIEGRELRVAYLRHYFEKLTKFPELVKRGLSDVIPVVNGRSEAAAWNIGMTGFNYSPSLDPGYYGSGIYLTTRLDCALGYGDHLVIALANPGNIYPVIEQPFEKGGTVSGSDGKPLPNKLGYLGKPLVGGYQSHYSVVKGGYPVKEIEENSMDELVVFQSAQVFPLFIVKYDFIAGMRASISSTTLNTMSSSETATRQSIPRSLHSDEIDKLRAELRKKEEENEKLREWKREHEAQKKEKKELKERVKRLKEEVVRLSLQKETLEREIQEIQEIQGSR